MLVVFLTIFIDMTGYGMIIPILPFYAGAFQLGSLALGVLMTSFALMHTISSPILGRFSDKIGRRPIILLSLIISAVSFVILSLANSFLILLLSRIIGGLATEVTVAQAYISDITQETDRAAAMGKIGAALGAGFIIGPSLGGFFSTWGLSTAGLVAAILALFNFAIVLFFLPESKVIYKEKNNLGEKTTFLQGFSNALSKPSMILVLIIVFIFNISFSAFPVIMPMLAISIFEATTYEISIFFAYSGLLQIIFQGFIIGKISRRIDEKKLIPIGLFLNAMGFFFQALAPNFTVLMFIVTFSGIGGWIFGVAIPSYVSKRISANEIGGMLGVTHSVENIANIPGPMLGGFLFDIAGPRAPFFVNTGILMIATILGIKLYVSPTVKNQKSLEPIL